MSEATNTARVNTDTARIDKLKELYRSVPMQLDFERIMEHNPRGFRFLGRG